MIEKENLVVCSVYNEEATLRKFCRKLRRCYSQDVLFVDDGSTDKGKDFLVNIIDERTFLIRHPERKGYGAALLSGFKFSLQRGYKRIVTIDTDLQHNPEHLPAFLRELIEYEVVLGSRYIRIDKYLEVPRERMIINRYIARMIKLLFSVNFTDPFCGYRGYRDTFLNRVYFRENSYGIGLEILLEIVRTKTSFKEIPIEVIYFNCQRKFLDGLAHPKQRLLYYLEVITRKKKDIENEPRETFSFLRDKFMEV